jgi:hypothetical protein
MTRFIILNARQTMLVVINPDGAMRSMHTQTPSVQAMLISSDDPRRTIRMIKGIFHSGITTALISPTVSIILILSPFEANAVRPYVIEKNLTNVLRRRSTSLIVSGAVLVIPKPSTLNDASVVAYKSALRKVVSFTFPTLLK